MSSTTPTSSSNSSNTSNPYATGTNSANPNPDPFSTSPSVYLYGFLATLILIFLISLFVAYRGYRTRRMLRQRIEEALARGVNLSGYPDFNSRGRGRGVPIGEKPSLWDVWIQPGDVPEKSSSFAMLGSQSGAVPSLLYADWDSLKPIAITSTQRRPIPEDTIAPNPPLVRPIPSRFPHSIIEAFREYWLPGESATPASRAAMPAGWNDSPSLAPAISANDAPSSQPSNTTPIVDALEKARIGVFIAMPDPLSSHRSHQHSSRGALNRQSIASTSTLGPKIQEISSSGHEELPELVIGTADVSLTPPEVPNEDTSPLDLQRETTAEASTNRPVADTAPRSSTTA